MTITVDAITDINEGEQACISITISNGKDEESVKLTLLTEQYADLRIKKGDISRERFDEIERAADICKAYKKGLFLLGYGATSEKNLIYKLKSKGFDSDISAEAAKMLLDKGYIRENDDAERIAEQCLSKLWGRKRIIAHLFSKGFSDNAVKGVDEYLDEVDFVSNCARLIKRDHKRQLDAAIRQKDRTEMNKLFSSLVRMGYSFSEIKEASAIITADDADEDDL